MKINELKYITVIGQGFFCVVKKYKDIASNKNIAIKKLKSEHLNNEDYKHRFLREIRITKDLSDADNVIDIIAEGEEGEFWYAMPCADANLYNYIRTNNAKLSLKERLNIVDQVIDAIKSAHDIEILHRDLSPQNILIFISDGIVKVKVSDFGLGKDMKSLSHLTRVEAEGYGRDFYVAPEQYEDLNASSKKSDIYSLGKIIYFIMTGKVPNIINQCELSVIINKSIKENPDERYDNINDLIKEYNSLKKLMFGGKVDLDKATVLRYLQVAKQIDWFEFHKVVIQSIVNEHVFYDYLEPCIDFLLKDNNLKKYYKTVGESINEFVDILISNVNQCSTSVGWPFSYTGTFGDMLNLIYKEIDIDEVKIKCLENLWDLGVEQNQWSVQNIIRDIIQYGNIPESIVYTFADYISRSNNKNLSINSFYYRSIQEPIRNALEI